MYVVCKELVYSFIIVIFQCTLSNIFSSVKKDAHAMILEFIRSRPPLRKVGFIVIDLNS